jgi:hypothetical protein
MPPYEPPDPIRQMDLPHRRIYGLLLMFPIYGLEARIGQRPPPPITHPEYYYGFVGTTLATPTSLS